MATPPFVRDAELEKTAFYGARNTVKRRAKSNVRPLLQHLQNYQSDSGTLALRSFEESERYIADFMLMGYVDGADVAKAFDGDYAAYDDERIEWVQDYVPGRYLDDLKEIAGDFWVARGVEVKFRR